MLRRLLLYLSAAGWASSMVIHFPLARRVALRFVAGETLQSALETTRQLNEQDLAVSLDYLGESIHNAQGTREVVATYQQLLEAIHEQDLQAGISLKLTHLGLDIGEDLCQSNLQKILTTAETYNIPVTIDMEGSAYTETTLRIYRAMRYEHDFQQVGTVIQAYLYRSAEDMRQLAEMQAHIRLCKGAYLESPEIAFPDKADVDANYIRLADCFLQSEAYLCIATHDEKMIQAAIDSIERYQTPSDQYEFQMLYGIRSARQSKLVAQGYKMRVYVPFGEAWYPYFMRRLAERPANLWFFARALFQR